MKKIITTENGKQFEAFLKLKMTTVNSLGEKVLIGVAYAGSATACRAIHASLYDFRNPYIEIYDEETGTSERIRTSQSYKRIEEVNGKVTHVFALPRNSIEKDYNDEVLEHAKSENEYIPEKTILTEGNLTHAVGHFLADAFGLPKTEDWINRYQSSLPFEKIQKVDVETTSISGELKDLKAIIIKPLKEEEMLSYIEIGIRQGVFRTKSENIQNKATFEKNWSTEDYLRANTEQLVSKIDQYMQPLYDGTHFSKYIAETNRVCVPAQARAVMGLNSILKEKNGAFLVGMMGTGKTQVSLTSAYVKARERERSGAKDGFRSLIVAPSNVLPKWATSEIPITLGRTCTISSKELMELESYRYSNNQNEFLLWKKFNMSNNIATILNSTEDALDYIKLIRSGWKIPKGKIHFVLVSTDRMKLHAFGFVLGARWNPYRHQWISPNTGKPLQSPKDTIEDIKAGELADWSDAVEVPSLPPTLDEIDEARKNGQLNTQGLPIGYVQRWQRGVRSFQDNYEEKDNKSLARPALNSLGETRYRKRWMIAQLFQRMLPNHFHLGIFDEIHQMKAQGSGRGLAFHKILKSCRKSIFLTGTLTNGASSSIQAVLWRVFPGEMIEHGFTHETSVEAWAERYGVLERVRRLDNELSEFGVTTNQRANRVIVKEKPGISPELVANHLLDKSVFLELSDLDVPMVTLEEKPIVIELDEDHKEEYRKFHEEMYETAKKLQKELGASAWSRFNSAVLNYADQPSLDMNIEFRGKDGEFIAGVKPTEFPKEYETAKERKLVKLVKERLKRNRGVMIYTNYTQSYQTNERLEKVLKNNGIEPVILDGKTSVDKRFEWIEEQERLGTKVVICNQRLVEVGLDLLAFPTIIFWQMNDDINTVRQSAKRAHRLGQNLHCEVLYLVNDGTQQMAQFQRLMSRRVSALLVEGAIERSDDLVKYADISVSELTNDLSRMLESSEITSAWEKTAEKDIDTGLEMVSEDELQEKITESFARLTEETKKLCGYVEPVENDEKRSLEDEWIALGFDAEEQDMTCPYGGLSLFDYAEESEEELINENNGKKMEQMALFDF